MFLNHTTRSSNLVRRDFFSHSRGNGNPGFIRTSENTEYPLEFIPYLIRGGYDRAMQAIPLPGGEKGGTL